MYTCRRGVYEYSERGLRWPGERRGVRVPGHQQRRGVQLQGRQPQRPRTQGGRQTPLARHVYCHRYYKSINKQILL